VGEADGRYDAARVQTRAEQTRGGFRLDRAQAVRARWSRRGPSSWCRPRTPARCSLFVVDAKAPGVGIRPVKTLDGRRAALVDLDVEVGADRRLAATVRRR